jgi:hypothetical protein
MTRRRENDNDWNGIDKRESPFTDPSTDWGRKIEDRMGNLEEGHQELTRTINKIQEDTGQLVTLFKGSKLIFIILAAIASLLASGSIVWGVIKDHVK